MRESIINLSGAGWGKLGACTTACFASKGFCVIVVDKNNDYVTIINNSKKN